MIKKLAITLMFALAAATAAAKQDLPAVSHDGLHLVPDTKAAAVYMKPGADLGQFDKIALLDTYVAFRKNWQREHNEEVPFSERVDDKDMERIKKTLADEFRKVFVRELQDKGDYQVVTEKGPDVLLLRPAIINLDVTAPDVMQAGRSRTYTSSAGQMTLYLELFDSNTSDIIARVVDPQAARDAGMIRMSSSVTNKAEADRILRKWADLLRRRLDEVHGKDS